MPPKRSSPDADPPRRVSARRASTPGLPEQGRGLRHIPPEAIVWGMKSTTCLSLGLDPVNADHKPVVCNNCTAYWQIKLNYDITKNGNEKRVRRFVCERPFDYRDSAEKGKKHARERMKALFSVTPAAVIPAAASRATRASPAAQHAVSPVPFRLAPTYQSPVANIRQP